MRGLLEIYHSANLENSKIELFTNFAWILLFLLRYVIVTIK